MLGNWSHDLFIFFGRYFQLLREKFKRFSIRLFVLFYVKQSFFPLSGQYWLRYILDYRKPSFYCPDFFFPLNILTCVARIVAPVCSRHLKCRNSLILVAALFSPQHWNSYLFSVGVFPADPCGRAVSLWPLALLGLSGSNPAGGMDICRECCVLWSRGLCVLLVTPECGVPEWWWSLDKEEPYSTRGFCGMGRFFANASIFQPYMSAA